MSDTWTLGQKRRLHTRLIAQLVDEMVRRGYLPQLGEGYVGLSIDKPGEDTPHRRDGGHLKGIAQDIDLFQCQHRPAHDGEACPDPTWLRDGRAHAPFGMFWVKLHPLCRWSVLDGDHYGLEDAGVSLR